MSKYRVKKCKLHRVLDYLSQAIYVTVIWCIFSYILKNSSEACTFDSKLSPLREGGGLFGDGSRSVQTWALLVLLYADVC